MTTHGWVVLVLGLTACAPQLRHLDGTVLRPVRRPMTIPSGWLVLDSCAVGFHMLVEMRIETEGRDRRLPDLRGAAARIGAGDRWRPGRVRVDGPACSPSPSGRGPELGVGQTDAPVSYGIRGERRHCLFTIETQFDLDRMPVSGDSIVVVYGRHLVQLAWH